MSDAAGNVENGEEPVALKPKMIKKQKYFASLQKALDEFDQAFLVNADNVGSKQIQQIRASTRPESLIIFGKNTQMKKAISQKVKENPDLEALLPHLVGNVGLVFTKGNLKEVRDKISTNKVPAPARAGSVAQCAVTIPAGLSGMEPTQTAFFQALNIPTKISKGQIEIINDVKLFEAGDKVSSSEVALLAKMGIKPFTFGLQFEQVFDKGAIYSPDVLDITDEHLQMSFANGIARIAAASLQLGFPTQASVPHSMMAGLKKMVAVSLVTDYCIGPAEKLKSILDDPEALAALAAAASGGGGGGGGAAEPAKEEAKKEDSESEEEEKYVHLKPLLFASRASRFVCNQRVWYPGSEQCSDILFYCCFASLSVRSLPSATLTCSIKFALVLWDASRFCTVCKEALRLALAVGLAELSPTGANWITSVQHPANVAR
jgi:large subunit ribosomal protein LP0